MFENLLDERFQRSICFLLLSDYCMRVDPNYPMTPANALLKEFEESIKTDLKAISNNNQDVEIEKLEGAESELQEYIEKWRAALFQQFTINSEK